MKKILITMLLMAAPATVLATQPWPTGPEQDTPATGNNAAKSHHARHRQKRSRHSSHKAQKHHVSKQHSQPQ